MPYKGRYCNFLYTISEIIYQYNFYFAAIAEGRWIFSKYCNFDINHICKITETKEASLRLQHDLQEISKFIDNMKHICKVTETKATSFATRTPGNNKIIDNLKTFFNIYIYVYIYIYIYIYTHIYIYIYISLVKGALLTVWALDRGGNLTGGFLTVGLRTGGLWQQGAFIIQYTWNSVLNRVKQRFKA